MIEAGVLKNVDAIIGLHLEHLPGTVGVRSGALMAAVECCARGQGDTARCLIKPLIRLWLLPR